MKHLIIGLGTICLSFSIHAQLDRGNFSGNLESTFQYLNEDTVIGAQQPPEKALLNTYMNVFYTHGNFKAGARLESYLPRIQGYPSNFDGTGLGMRYVGYANDFIDVTVGHFYEQFGTGLALRIYEDRALGYDNMLDGIKLKLTPLDGISIKGVYGRQRVGFNKGRLEYTNGIVRGVDGEFNFNRVFKKLQDKKLNISIGGSLVSKYQQDNNPDWILPENVGVYGGRARIRYGKFSLDGEYVVKGQDPSQDNAYIYNPGHATVINATYSQRGLGILLSAKSVDNMSYRSDRTMQLQNALINFLPSINKTHTYNLVSSLYPYATQPTGEMAFQGEVLYTIPRGSKLGGKYGTSINVNYSAAFRPLRHTSSINPDDSTGVTYTTSAFDISDSLYWSDFNVQVKRKINKRLYVQLSYYNQILNNDVATVAKETGNIKSNIFVLEAGYKFKNRSSLRAEYQMLFTNRRDSMGRETSFSDPNGIAVDQGDWATLLLEYTINTHWFVSIMDQYNFGNPSAKKRAHHPYLSVGYIQGPTRITANYGRQRAGLFCVGGVCRPVPASNGLTVSVTHSF